MIYYVYAHVVPSKSCSLFVLSNYFWFFQYLIRFDIQFDLILDSIRWVTLLSSLVLHSIQCATYHARISHGRATWTCRGDGDQEEVDLHLPRLGPVGTSMRDARMVSGALQDDWRQIERNNQIESNIEKIYNSIRQKVSFYSVYEHKSEWIIFETNGVPERATLALNGTLKLFINSTFISSRLWMQLCKWQLQWCRFHKLYLTQFLTRVQQVFQWYMTSLACHGVSPTWGSSYSWKKSVALVS